ncbi:hypothetical protein [Rhizobium ruizarguesonis]|uniref:hypothetical protein n=1 Tax=Rhizobium ruizarguesonis TaxID=2081791 RepID=UPI0013EEE2F4|nr:hypothetical protein [Rhizobium ruizarguesonis]
MEAVEEFVGERKNRRRALLHRLDAHQPRLVPRVFILDISEANAFLELSRRRRDRNRATRRTTSIVESVDQELGLAILSDLGCFHEDFVEYAPDNLVLRHETEMGLVDADLLIDAVNDIGSRFRQFLPRIGVYVLRVAGRVGLMCGHKERIDAGDHRLQSCLAVSLEEPSQAFVHVENGRRKPDERLHRSQICEDCPGQLQVAGRFIETGKRIEEVFCPIAIFRRPKCSRGCHSLAGGDRIAEEPKHQPVHGLLRFPACGRLERKLADLEKVFSEPLNELALVHFK